MREIKRQVDRLLRAQPAPRARGRVGLRPAAQADHVLPVFAGWLRADPQRARPSCTAASTSACPILVLSLGPLRRPSRDGRRRARERHRARRRADPAVGHVLRAARHLRRQSPAPATTWCSRSRARAPRVYDELEPLADGVRRRPTTVPRLPAMNPVTRTVARPHRSSAPVRPRRRPRRRRLFRLGRRSATRSSPT